MGGTNNQDILAVEIMKYMGRSYEEYLSTPYDIIQTILVRIDLESKNH